MKAIKAFSRNHQYYLRGWRKPSKHGIEGLCLLFIYHIHIPVL